MIEKLIIGPPFGNHLLFPHATSTLGTFTYRYRGGTLKQLWRVLRTVRFYPRLGAWVNRLGLPNPGIDWLVERADSSLTPLLGPSPVVRDKIVSIMGHSNDEWAHLFGKVFRLYPAAVEMNVSCPNCPGEDATDYFSLFPRLAAWSEWEEWSGKIIVKLPPVGYKDLVRFALDAGVRSFHCCNTLSSPGGGISGKPLQQLSLRCMTDLFDIADAEGHELQRIIGGGGVTSMEDARRFLDAGARNVSVASVLFFPWKWRTVRRMAEELRVR